MLVLYSCSEDVQNEVLPIVGNVEPELLQNEETLQMISELEALVLNANPKDYCHMNSEQAEWLHQRISIGDLHEQMNTWFQYCTQLLYAGESQACIDELKTYFEEGPKVLMTC